MVGLSWPLIPQERVAVSASTFLKFILPAFASYFAMGLLVQRKHTAAMRFALLPIVLLSAYRAGVTLDFSFGNPKQRGLNQSLALAMFSISMRSIAWAFVKKPYKRNDLPNETSNCDNNHSTDADDVPLTTAIWNAWDLLANFRGIGWDWSQGIHIPKSSYETRSTIVFLLNTLAKLLLYALAFDITSGATRSFSLETFGSIEGGTIFDASLPPLSRYTRSAIITLLAGWTAYFSIELTYHMYALQFVLLFRQGPSQWPPMFDAPWFSTSLTSFWGHDWHQMFRECFVSIAVRPLSHLLGRSGGVLGAFLASGALHYVGLKALGRGGHPIPVFGFFFMQGVGVILEGVWKRCSGVRVSGWLGMLWTWFWMVLWGSFMVDAWGKTGWIGSSCFPDDSRPTILLAQFVNRHLGLW